jgi:hypothetical protein
MQGLLVATRVAAPIDFVFARAVEELRWQEMIPGVKAVEMVTLGPLQVGSRFRETREMYGRLATEEMEVTALDPPRGFTLEAHSHGTHYLAQHAFHEDGGQTRMSMEFSGKPESLFARMMTPLGWLMTNSVRKLLVADLDALKSAIERDYAAQGNPHAE